MSDPNPGGDKGKGESESESETPPDPSSESPSEPATSPSSGPADPPSVASTSPSSGGGGTDAGPGTGTGAGTGPVESVAGKAGIDDEVIGTPRRLDPNVRFRWIVGSTIGAVVTGGLVGAGVYVLGSVVGQGRDASVAAGVGGAVFALLVLLGIVRAVLLYRSWEYVVREDSLFLSRGVLTRVRTVAPYVRVQHIDTQRGPLERLLGLSTLVVYTAGSRGADVTIPGLAPDRATDLQARLKRLAIESEEEDAV